MVPLQDPMRYFPLAQFKLLHAAQAVFEVPVQPPDLYLPASHDAHVLHWNPFVVPLQDPLRYFPLAQLMLPHVVHVPGLLPDRYLLTMTTHLFQILPHAQYVILPFGKRLQAIIWQARSQGHVLKGRAILGTLVKLGTP